MAYIGKEPLAGNFVKLDAITTSATATYPLERNSVAFKPANAESLLVSLNGVTQAPLDAYTVNDTDIVFASPLTSSDTIDYILALGEIGAVTTPADSTVDTPKLTTGAVTEPKLATDSVTTTKIANDAVTGAKIENNPTIAGNLTVSGTSALTGDVTLSGHLASGVNKNIDLRDADGHVSGRLRNVSGSNNALTIEADPDNSASDTFISFKVDTSEKMRIKSNGNVGIGINDPSHQLHIESSGSNTYATMKLEGQNRGGQIDMFQNTLITNQILGDQSGNLYFGSSGGFGQVAIDSQAYMSATNKAFGFRTSTFLTTMADDTIKTIVTNGCGLIIVSSYTYGRVAIYKHDYIGGTTLITGDTLYYATTNTDGKYSVESGSNSFTAQLRNRFGGNADFKVMFIGTYQ